MSAEVDLVEVAWVGDQYEAAMIQELLEEGGIPSLEQQTGIDGPQLGFGLLTGSGSRRVMVHAHRAEEARALLAEAMTDNDTLPESVNAEYLEDAQGRRLRVYGLLGAYARACFWSFLVMAAAFGAFMLLRALGIA